jgi:hypothetical protein
MAEDEFHNLRADIATAVERVEADLADRGCEAGDYRLTGSKVDHICVIHLRDRRGKELADNWRVLIAFPGPDEVAVIDIGRHDPKRARKIYDDIYGRLGLAAPPSGKRTKPPCCDATGLPPVDPVLLETFDLLAKGF